MHDDVIARRVVRRAVRSGGRGGTPAGRAPADDGCRSAEDARAARPAAVVAARRGLGNRRLRPARRGAAFRVAARRADDPRLFAAHQRLVDRRAFPETATAPLLVDDFYDRGVGRCRRRAARAGRARRAGAGTGRLGRARHRPDHHPDRRSRLADHRATYPTAAARRRGGDGGYLRRRPDDGVRAHLRAWAGRGGHVLAAVRADRRRSGIARVDPGRLPDRRPADHLADHQRGDSTGQRHGRHPRLARSHPPEQRPRHHRGRLPRTRRHRARHPGPRGRRRGFGPFGATAPIGRHGPYRAHARGGWIRGPTQAPPAATESQR